MDRETPEMSTAPVTGPVLVLIRPTLEAVVPSYGASIGDTETRPKVAVARSEMLWKSTRANDGWPGAAPACCDDDDAAVPFLVSLCASTMIGTLLWALLGYSIYRLVG